MIGRYSDLPEEYPEVAHFHTMRINQPAGWLMRMAWIALGTRIA